MQKPARICQDNPIDFFFVPADAFGEREFYKTEITDKLTVNGNEFEVLVLPYAQFITPETAQAIQELAENGGKVLIIDARPEGLINGDAKKLKWFYMKNPGLMQEIKEYKRMSATAIRHF